MRLISYSARRRLFDTLRFLTLQTSRFPVVRDARWSFLTPVEIKCLRLCHGFLLMLSPHGHRRAPLLFYSNVAMHCCTNFFEIHSHTRMRLRPGHNCFGAVLYPVRGPVGNARVQLMEFATVPPDHHGGLCDRRCDGFDA